MVSNPARGGPRNQPAPYQVLRPLARGGMGEVLVAVRREGSFTRIVALKRLHPHLREDPDIRRMFLNEARIAGLLSHPHLISVVDVGENEDGPFLVMEYVQGVSVAQVIQKAITEEREIPIQFAVHVARQAALGLQAAHEAQSLDGKPLGLVHRDVTPHNLLVGYDGMTRVTDFGIARAIGRSPKTSTGVLKGKLGYMSPEQLSFQGQDPRSDLFSLGVTFFELLAARRLYPSADGEKTARRILHEPPPDILDDRDDVPPELAELLFRLLAKDPDLRPQTAGDLSLSLQDIEAQLAEELGPFQTAEYLKELFAHEREVAAALIAESLERAAQAPNDPEEETAATDEEKTVKLRRKNHPWLFVAAALASLALVATAIGGFTRGPGELTHDADQSPEKKASAADALDAPPPEPSTAPSSPQDERAASGPPAEREGAPSGDPPKPKQQLELQDGAPTPKAPKPSPEPKQTARPQAPVKKATGVRTWEW